MELIDGLTYYKRENQEYYNWAIRLEAQAKGVLELLAASDSQPEQSVLDEAKAFLMEVEEWKAGCLNTRIGNAAKNSERDIWYAFLGAHQASDDEQAVLSIIRMSAVIRRRGVKKL